MGKFFEAVATLALIWVVIFGGLVAYNLYTDDLHIHTYVHKNHNIIGNSELNETYPHNHKEDE